MPLLDLRGRLYAHPRWRRWSRWPRRLLALTLLIIAAVLALREPPQGAPADSTPVLVATHDLSAGALLGIADTMVAQWPGQLVPRGALRPDAAVGRILAGAVRAGEPLTDVRLLGSGLAVGLPTGWTAAPVRLADPAVAELLRPGDRVDLYGLPTDDSQSVVKIAAAARVLAVPITGEGGVTSSGVIVVAVTDTAAAALISAAYSAAIAATLAAP